MTQQFENFVNAALDKSLASDVTLPTANEIPVFTGIGRQVTGKTKAELGLATSSQLTGKADLVDGLVPASQLPGYVDDVLEYANLASFPLLGEASKLYIAIDTNLVYRWGGSTYAVTSSSLALGDTTTTAYYGDKGKIAYDHSQATGNPHNLPAASTSADGYLTSTDWNTFNGKQAALGNVITANTYGSSTQYPKVTVNAKGIVTGITLQTVPTPTFTDATFAVQKNGSPSISATWNLTAFTESHVHTYPDKDINFGNMSSVATTDSNTLSGTSSRIVGGNNNNVSGTGGIVVGGGYNVLAGTDGVIAGSEYSSITSNNSNCFIAGSKRAVIASTGDRNSIYGALGGSSVSGASIDSSGSRNLIFGSLCADNTANGSSIIGTASDNFIFGARANYTLTTQIQGNTTRCTIVSSGGGIALNNCSDSVIIGMGGNSITTRTWTSAVGVLSIGNALPVQSPANGSSYYGVGTTSSSYSAEFRLYNNTAATNLVLTTDGSGTVSATNAPNIEAGANTYDIDIYLVAGLNRVASCRRKVFVNPSFAYGNVIEVETIGTDITWSGCIPTITITIDATVRLKISCSATDSALTPLAIQGSAFVTMKSF